MEINREEFKSILETVKYGLANKEVLEGSTSFYFDGQRVVTFNDEVSVSKEIKGLDFEGEVSANELLSLVSKMRTKQITLSIKDGVLLIKGGRTKAGMSIKPDSSLPIESIGKIKKWNKLPKEVLESINFVKHACGTDFLRPILTCAHINKDFVEGTDGFRLAHITLDEECPIEDFLLPAHIINFVTALKPTKIAGGSESWVHFKNEEGAVLSCRVFVDTFPNTSHLIDYSGKVIVFPDNIIEILDRVSVFKKADEGADVTALIIIENNKMLISSDSDTGWISERVKIDYKGEPFEMNITIPLLVDILKVTKKAKVSDTKIAFKEGNKNYTVMLRVTKKEE